MKVLTEILLFLTLWVALISGVLYLVARRRPVPEGIQQRRRAHSACCLEVPCSSICTTRQQALVATGAVDGAKHAARIHELLAGPEYTAGAGS